jgi:hypothetical protein
MSIANKIYFITVSSCLVFKAKLEDIKEYDDPEILSQYPQDVFLPGSGFCGLVTYDYEKAKQFVIDHNKRCDSFKSYIFSEI